MGRLIQPSVCTSQPQMALAVNRNNPFVPNIKNLLVASRSSYLMQSLWGVNDGGGYGAAGHSKLITPAGSFQVANGGGYADTSNLAYNYPTDGIGIVVFAVFYIRGAVGGTVVGAAGISGQSDCLMNLDGSSRLTVTANTDYTYTSPVLADGVHTAVFSNLRMDGRQTLWIDGVLVNTGASIAQRGFTSNGIKCGTGTTGTFAIGFCGAGVGGYTYAAAFARAFADNPWQLFIPSIRTFPALSPVVYVPPTTIFSGKTRAKPLVAQPQQGVSLNLNNPIANGLLAAPLLNQGGYDPVGFAKFSQYGTSSLDYLKGISGRKFAGAGTIYSSIKPSWPATGVGGITLSIKAIIPTAALGTLISTSTDTDTGYFVIGTDATGTVICYHRGAGGGPTLTTTDPFGPRLNTPLDICAIYSTLIQNGNTNHSLYINGNLVISHDLGTFSGNNLALMNNICVGSLIYQYGALPVGNLPFTGTLAAPVVFNRALNASEVKMLSDNAWQVYKREPTITYVETPYVAPAALTGGATKNRNIAFNQPQQGVTVDLQNSLAVGLASLVLAPLHRDLISGAGPIPNGSSTIVSDKLGFGLNFVRATPGREIYPIRPFTGDATFFIVGGLDTVNASTQSLAALVGTGGRRFEFLENSNSNTNFSVAPVTSTGTIISATGGGNVGRSVWIGVVKGTAVSFYKAGLPIGTATTVGTDWTDLNGLQIGCTDFLANPSGTIFMAGYATRAWDLSEIVSFSQDPYKLLRTKDRKSWVQTTAGASNAYILPVTNGTFALTGPTTRLAISRKVVGAAGSFAETGVATNFGLTHKITGAAGSFTLTGLATRLAVGRKFVGSTGSFAETGVVTNFGLTHKITGAVASYSIAGTSTRFAAGRKIVGSVGSFAETAGGNVAFNKVRFFVAAAGTYSITGINAKLSAGRKTVANTSSYTLTANTAFVDYNRKFGITAGSYSLTGINGAFVFTRKVAANTGAYTLAPVNSLFKYSRSLGAAAGSFTIAGVSTLFKAGRKVTGTAGSFAETTNTSGFVFTRKVNAVTGSLAITPKTLAWVYYRKLVANTDSYSIVAPTVGFGSTSAHQMGVNTGAFNVTGNSTAFKVSRKVPVNAGSLVETGSAATMLLTRKVGAVSANFVEAGTSTGLGFVRKIGSAAGNFAVTPSATGFKAARKLPVISGVITETGSATVLYPTRKMGSASGNFTVTTSATVIKPFRRLPAAVGIINETGIDAGVDYNRKLAVSTGVYSETGINVTLKPVRKMAAEATNFVFDSSDTGFNGLATARLYTSSRSFTLTGNGATLKATRRVKHVPDNFLVNGINVDLHPAKKLGVVAGTYGITNKAATLKVSRKFIVTKSVLVINGTPVIIKAARKMRIVDNGVLLASHFDITYKFVSVRVSGTIRNIFSSRFRNMFISL